MQIDTHVHPVQEQLRAAAALGDERTQQIAEALAGAATAAVRLAILNALAQATVEINSALLDCPSTRSVALHLDGDEVLMSVSAPPEEHVAAQEGDATARISLRLPERLKADVEQAASQESISVNTWLVRAARNGLTSNRSGRADSAGRGDWAPPGRGGHRITGWVSG